MREKRIKRSKTVKCKKSKKNEKDVKDEIQYENQYTEKEKEKEKNRDKERHTKAKCKKMKTEKKKLIHQLRMAGNSVKEVLKMRMTVIYAAFVYCSIKNKRKEKLGNRTEYVQREIRRH